MAMLPAVFVEVAHGLTSKPWHPACSIGFADLTNLEIRPAFD